MEYVIVGDGEFKDSLVCICGKKIEFAKQCLSKMLKNPTENDKHLMESLTNFRIAEVKDEDCWWNFGCD